MHKAQSWDLPYLESSGSGTMMVNGRVHKKKKKETVLRELLELLKCLEYKNEMIKVTSYRVTSVIIRWINELTFMKSLKEYMTDSMNDSNNKNNNNDINNFGEKGR